MTDQRAVSDFIETFGITFGIVVADKGFSLDSMKEQIEENPGLYYVLPLKRDRAITDELHMYVYDLDLAMSLESNVRRCATRSMGRSSGTTHSGIRYHRGLGDVLYVRVQREGFGC